MTIINVPSGPADTIGVSGQGSLNLTAPTSGPFQGVVLFQDPASGNAVHFTGQAAVTLAGVVYVPAALVSIDGNANVTINAGPGTASAPPRILGALIAYDLKVDSNGVLTINPDDPPSGPMTVASTAAPSSAGTDAVSSATSSVPLSSGGGSSAQGEDDLLVQVSILLSRNPQVTANTPSPAVPTTNKDPAILFSWLSDSFGAGTAPPGASTEVQPHGSMDSGVDPLSDPLSAEV